MRWTTDNLPFRIKNRIHMILDGLEKKFINYVLYPFVKRKMAKYHILDRWESIEYIKEHRCSLSRYGDGEIQVIRGGGNGFQSPNKKLGQKLKDVFLGDDAPNHMVGISKNFQTVSGLVGPMNFWPMITVKFYHLLSHLLSTDRVYLDASFTRFYFEREDKSRSLEQLNKIKSIWDGQDIVIVEGYLTRSGVGNDLYDNAKSVRRILGPATNAFDKYEEMLSCILNNVPVTTLVLLAYGMTATVLAYDLAKCGYWAIDIGHLDVEYEWYRAGGKNRVKIQGKYVNEVVNGNAVEECRDENYLSQIICDITKK